MGAIRHLLGPTRLALTTTVVILWRRRSSGPFPRSVATIPRDLVAARGGGAHGGVWEQASQVERVG